jgi:hypothetical protein
MSAEPPASFPARIASPPTPPSAPTPMVGTPQPKPSRIDTRVFLAVAIVTIFAAVTFILLFKPIAIDDKVYGTLSTLLGVLVACFKDVYNYSFGTTKDSGDKNQTIASQSVMLAQSSPITKP